MYNNDKNKYLAEVAAKRFQEELDGTTGFPKNPVLCA